MGMRKAVETVLGSVPGTVEQRGWAHQLAHATRWVGIEVGVENGTRSFLGIVG